VTFDPPVGAAKESKPLEYVLPEMNKTFRIELRESDGLIRRERQGDQNVYVLYLKADLK
jgi:hypothetical protein